MKNIVDLTEDTIEDHINNSEASIVVFGSKGTPNTTNALRVLDVVETNTKIGFVNIEVERALMREYSIRMTPTVVSFVDGFPTRTLSARPLSENIDAIKECGDVSCLIG